MTMYALEKNGSTWYFIIFTITMVKVKKPEKVLWQ